jgi:ribosomal protein S18 acetylase RimI-like enzyme
VTTRAIRSATVGDAAAISSVHVASRDDAYAPLAVSWPTDNASERTAMWLEILRKQDEYPLVLVAELDGTVVGFVSGGSARRTEPGSELEIYVIHVHPAHRGRALGADLWSAACHALRGPALASMYVDTLAELRCCSFYERRGGHVAERRPIRFHGARRTHVTYRWASGAPSEQSP